MNRRTFLTTSAASAAAPAGLGRLATAQESEPMSRPDFKLHYAPHFGMFKHHAGDDPVDQLQFMADSGFTAIEDNGMLGRDEATQERIAAALARLNLKMGVFVAYADFRAQDFVRHDPAFRGRLRQQMEQAVATAERVNAKWVTVVPGCVDPRLDPGYQFAGVVDNLRACCDVCEPAGLTMVLEPLNKRDHPNLFLTHIHQAYAICRAVDRPACKILDDLYHQQISEGDLIPNIDAAWDEIAYFQVGDNPGRREPTTGEINYRNIFKHLHAKGFDGIVGMEHGLSQGGKAGERALIDAYVLCDSF